MTVKEYKGESTEELIANKRDKEIAKENPDVILFEPPFITDNSKTGNGNSVANTQKFVQALSISAKGATIMIQPSNPVYGAKNYPKSIEALKQFAAQNNYTYIDYWERGLMQQQRRFYHTYKKNLVSQVQKDMTFGRNM